MHDWLSAAGDFGTAVGIGTGGGVGFFAIRWAATFLAGRYDKREAVLDSGTQLLIRQLQDQVKDLLERQARTDEALEECKHQHAEARREVMELRGMIQGRGDARQEAARIVAIEKLGDKS